MYTDVLSDTPCVLGLLVRALCTDARQSYGYTGRPQTSICSVDSFVGRNEVRTRAATSKSRDRRQRTAASRHAVCPACPCTLSSGCNTGIDFFSSLLSTWCHVPAFFDYRAASIPAPANFAFRL